uniref:Uncharacterized protein n=1 Tax=Chenopodium quinoa TaxID=63459 RepID=A0A803KRU8_CHEQI
MRHFSFRGAVSEEVYINCPKLDDFRFKSGQSKLPTIVTLNQPTAIWYRLEFDVWCDLDTVVVHSLKEAPRTDTRAEKYLAIS